MSINSGIAYVLGIELDIDNTLTCALLDLNCKFIKRSVSHICPEMTKEEIFGVIEKSIENIKEEVSIPGVEILGIGFGDPGFVDSRNGICKFSSRFPNWREANIAERLSKNFGLPVFVQDLSRLKCLAEADFGAAKGVKGFIYIDYGDGIGLGVYSNGKLFTGEQGYGCEIGHMVIDPNGPICGCGGKGCLEAIASTRAIIKQAAEAVANGVQTSINVKPGMAADAIAARHIFTAAQENDRLAVTLVNSVIQTLGLAIGNVCNLFNPSMVVLGGEMPEFPSVWAPIKKVIHTSVIPFISQELTISFSTLSDQGGILGAAQHVIEKLLYPE